MVLDFGIERVIKFRAFYWILAQLIDYFLELPQFVTPTIVLKILFVFIVRQFVFSNVIALFHILLLYLHL